MCPAVLHIEAVRLCTRLVNDSPDDQAVLRISQVLLKAYSSTNTLIRQPLAENY